MSSRRLQKINELIRQELGKILLKEINFPDNCLVTITNVITSADLGQSKVIVSVMPSNRHKEIIDNLNKKAGFCRFQLGKILVIRKIPSLIFQFDTTQDKIAQLDQLIDKIRQEK